MYAPSRERGGQQCGRTTGLHHCIAVRVKVALLSQIQRNDVGRGRGQGFHERVRACRSNLHLENRADYAYMFVVSVLLR